MGKKVTAGVHGPVGFPIVAQSHQACLSQWGITFLVPLSLPDMDEHAFAVYVIRSQGSQLADT
jgi:hypothetical protein